MSNKIKNALISVSDKENLKNVLYVLKRNKINVISSGGTYKSIKKLGFECREISEYTGFAAALTMLGPPISIFSIILFLFDVFLIVASNG